MGVFIAGFICGTIITFVIILMSIREDRKLNDTILALRRRQNE
ncbi:hypothetical protein ES704_02073 [subsurface metagenome]|jgi:hypothetical protein